MTAKRFVATKVGQRYELRPQSAPEKCLNWGWTAGGAVLALIGLSRRSFPGALAAAAGGGMVYCGLSGRQPLREIARLLRWRSEALQSTPSYPHDIERRATQVPRDEVEEASMESFPASDPPASTRAGPPQ